MLQTVNVSDQTLHGRSVAGRVFGCQIYIKCNFSERFVYFYFGNDSRELFHSEWASTRGINSENQSRIGYQFEVYIFLRRDT